MESLYTKLTGSRFYTKIDCFNGYFQILTDPESSHLTSFGCEFGLFKYVKLAQGLANAPATFQRLVDTVFKDQIARNTVCVYFDDFLIHTKTLAEHVKETDMTVSALKNYNLKVKLKKCDILKTKVRFLGQEIENGIIRPVEERCEALFRYEKPNFLKQLQSFIGLSNGYRKYIKDYAHKAHPLHDLIASHTKLITGSHKNKK